MRTREEQVIVGDIWRKKVQPDTSLKEILDVIREINSKFPDPNVQNALDAARVGSLSEVLEVIREINATVPTPEVLRGLEDARANLVSSGLADGALHAGDRAPDFELPDQEGRPVRLFDSLTKGPVVLSFYRGSWCPFCNLELRGLQQHLDEIERQGGTLIAVSPEPPDKTVLTAEQNQVRYSVLSDIGNAVAQTYRLVMEIPDAIREHQIRDIGFDVAEHNKADNYRVPVPATYVIDTDGTISLDYVNADYRYRLDPLDIIAHLRERAGNSETAQK